MVTPEELITTIVDESGTPHVQLPAFDQLWFIVPSHVFGEAITDSVFAELVPQLLPAVMLIFPFCPTVPVDTVIETVPVPAVIVQPVGTDHVYVVAFVTALTLYV